MVKNLPANAGEEEMQVQFLGQEDSHGERNCYPFQDSCLENLTNLLLSEEPDGLQSMGLQRVRHDRVTEHTQ